MNTLLIVGAVFIGIASLIHVYIFWMESITWAAPGTWRRFGIRNQEEADTIRPMAYNQGFYNGFLAIGGLAGIVLSFSPGLHQAGITMELVASLSMVLAATVLVVSNPALARAAILQGALPFIGAVLTVVGVLAS